LDDELVEARAGLERPGLLGISRDTDPSRCLIDVLRIPHDPMDLERMCRTRMHENSR
jgi:hypothetical protein